MFSWVMANNYAHEQWHTKYKITVFIVTCFKEIKKIASVGKPI